MSEVTYLVQDGKIVASIDGQGHVPISIESAAMSLNDLEVVKRKLTSTEAALDAYSARLAALEAAARAVCDSWFKYDDEGVVVEAVAIERLDKLLTSEASDGTE